MLETQQAKPALKIMTQQGYIRSQHIGVPHRHIPLLLLLLLLPPLLLLLPLMLPLLLPLLMLPLLLLLLLCVLSAGRDLHDLPQPAPVPAQPCA
jgi:hypothetical protein